MQKGQEGAPTSMAHEKGRATPSNIPLPLDSGAKKSDSAASSVTTSPTQNAGRNLEHAVGSHVLVHDQKLAHVVPGGGADEKKPSAKGKPAQEGHGIVHNAASMVSKLGLGDRSNEEQFIPHPEISQPRYEDVPTPQPPEPARSMTEKPAEGLQSQSDVQHETIHLPAGNGGSRKKAMRGKAKLKLHFQEMTDGNVVKCKLMTSLGQSINFKFSMEYDKPQEIFQKFVSSQHTHTHTHTHKHTRRNLNIMIIHMMS